METTITNEQWNELKHWQKTSFKKKVCQESKPWKNPDYFEVLDFLSGYEIGIIKPEASIELLWSEVMNILNAGKK